MSNYDSRVDTYQHIDRVRALVSYCIRELMDRANRHDASKLRSPEVEVFDKVTPLLVTTEYGSDEYKKQLEEMGPALEHHYAKNSHHPEFHENGIEGMNLLDLLEMICDWKASSERHTTGDIIRSVEVNQDRFGYDDQMKSILTNTAHWLAGR